MDPITKKRTQLFERAMEVFPDKESASLWISTPLAELGDLPPVALVESEEQLKRALVILDRIEFGIFA